MKTFTTFIFHVITGRFRDAFNVLRHLNLGTQLAFLGLGAASYAIHQYPTQLWLYAERASYVASIAAKPNTDLLPLSKSRQRELAQLIRTLEHDQIIELQRRNLGLGAGYNAWSVAQMSVALGAAFPVPAAELREYFDETLDPSCQCWHETPQAQPHLGATGWVVFSMSKLGIKSSASVLSSLLDLQSPEGWWSLYLPSRSDPTNAGTYPTAWAALALCSQLPLQTTGSAVSIDKMKFAVENALNWLSKNEIVQSARWNDYPASSPSMKSASIAGLILHVMDACGYTEGATALHRRWLNALPFEITSASATEMSNTNLYLKNNGLGIDRTRHYVLPWVLIATVDAYASGTFLERAAAVQWVERVLRPALLNPEVRSQNWVEAELLFALKYL